MRGCEEGIRGCLKGMRGGGVDIPTPTCDLGKSIARHDNNVRLSFGSDSRIAFSTLLSPPMLPF